MARADQVFQGKAARVPPGPWDVIVVGAGIYRLPTAFYLARPAASPVLRSGIRRSVDFKVTAQG